MAIVACKQDKPKTDLAAAQQRDSLTQVIAQKDNEINDLMSTMNEIEEGFREINEAENRLSLAKQGEGSNREQRIRENLQFIQSTMKQNRELIAKLQRQLREGTIKGDQLQRTIDNLTKQMEEKDQQLQQLRAELDAKDIHIMDLDEKIANLNTNVNNLTAEGKQKTETINSQDKQLHSAWYVFGTKSELKEQRIYVDGKNCTIDAQQANNESTTVQQILDQFKADGDDIIIAITTPCAQLAAPYSEEIPVVFSAVTDPIGAGLCDSLESTGANITGTSDKLAITKILDFALEMKPEIKTLGYLYNTGEDNSVSTLKEVKAYCEEKGITVVEGAASNTSEVQEAAQNLAAKCDAVFSPNDNTIAGAMGTVTEVMNKAKVPMFVGADSMVYWRRRK